MWKCPKCRREFLKTKQTHSCNVYPLENHFKNKEYAEKIFKKLVQKIKAFGKVKIDSVQCCIHLVDKSTFAAVWPQKTGLKMDFRLNYDMNNPRIMKKIKMSKNAYLYYLEISTENDIDKELLKWIKESRQRNA
ncbi:hypothetical protein COX58_00305 [archaeon CG_4_10_14_0_2_um_filter_Archaea_38_6]|nr:MAG: hypothetical protein COS83_00815 [archaeon CG07_land_8_20_14_0_80_38_8]PIU89398.1 MAG: hypothetical protein COS64_00815 [archaeon CG06_land_8_20_14_3_00_37_11]PJA23119.1 MAG: hypothetical protein COX58_00305 [archaeon CG_4_10_14_0_2_um_filter_Archaea_38_6]